MSSTPSSSKRFRQILDRTLALLDEDDLCRTIDAPLERAEREFSRREATAEACSQAEDLLRRLGSYLQFLYGRGLRVPRRLTDRQSEMEVLSLLQRHYQSLSGRGYEAAWVDSQGQGEVGIALLRDFLLDAVKQEERRKHLNWVIRSNVEVLNWQEKVAITQLLLRRLRHMGCEVLDPDTPWRFADYTSPVLLTYAGELARYRRWLSKP